MSAVYARDEWVRVWDQWYDEVTKYVTSNPGASIDAIATALSAPYAVVFAICSRAHIVMPSASGEITWRGDHHGI